MAERQREESLPKLTSAEVKRLQKLGAEQPVPKGVADFFKKFQKTREGKIDKKLSDMMAKSVNN